MKKKIIVPIFIIIITAAMIAGGTMSWFTGSDEVECGIHGRNGNHRSGRKIDINDSNSYENMVPFPDKVIFGNRVKH